MNSICLSEHAIPSQPPESIRLTAFDSNTITRVSLQIICIYIYLYKRETQKKKKFFFLKQNFKSYFTECIDYVKIGKLRLTTKLHYFITL